MRTTVTLEPDVEALLAKAMRERGISFKEALNSAVRKGLGVDVRVDYAFATYAMGTPRVDLLHASRVASDLEDEEILRKLEQGR